MIWDIDRWREIWASIRSNKLRTVLSGITIALALFVFITLFGLSKGLQNGFEVEFFPANVKALYVFSDQTTKAFRGNKEGRRVPLKIADYHHVKDKFAEDISIILPNIQRNMTARNFSEYGNYSIIGTHREEKKVRESTVIKGRFLDAIDSENREKNVVIGRLVEKDLFKNQSAVGQNIQLGSTLYKVVGVFSDEDGDDEERIIFMPIETMQIIYGTDEIDEISILPKDELPLAKVSQLSKDIEKDLKIRLGVHPQDSRGVRVTDPSDGLKQTNMFFYIFTIIVIVIGIGSLVAGIVSIGNMMVYSVKERTKEIGIRKALGARPINIIGLIMQEAMLITFLFGAIGILAAITLTESLQDSLTKYLIINPQVETSRIVMATVILFFSGLMAGFIPAYRAAKIKPIEALRND